MPDGIHCGPFNVSGSVGLHVRSGISATPTADVRLGQMFAQVDGHLGYIHPSGTAYTLTPPGSGEANTASNVGSGTGWFKEKIGVDLKFKSLAVVAPLTLNDDGNTVTLDVDIDPVSSGIDGMWQRYDSKWIRPINQNYGITVNSGTEANPGVSLPIGESKGMYAVGGPVPVGLVGISLDGLRAVTFQDLGFGAGLQVHLPKHAYGPEKPRLAGEGTSGTGLYFPSNSGIGLSSEGVIGLEINRQLGHMQARMPAGSPDDAVPGITFADHHHAGLQLPDAGDGVDITKGQVDMLIGAQLQSWSGTLITHQRDTLTNGKAEIVRTSTGVTLLRQRSAATNDYPTLESFQGRLAVSENTVGVLYSFTPATASNYTIKALVTVRQTVGTGIGIGRSLEIIAHVQNIGGSFTVTQVSNVSAGTLAVNSAAFAVGLGTVNLNVQVEGLSGSGKSYVIHAHIQRFGPTGT
jgi:hypothetical protein